MRSVLPRSHRAGRSEPPPRAGAARASCARPRRDRPRRPQPRSRATRPSGGSGARSRRRTSTGAASRLFRPPPPRVARAGPPRTPTRRRPPTRPAPRASSLAPGGGIAVRAAFPARRSRLRRTPRAGPQDRCRRSLVHPSAGDRRCGSATETLTTTRSRRARAGAVPGATGRADAEAWPCGSTGRARPRAEPTRGRPSCRDLATAAARRHAAPRPRTCGG